MKMESLKLEDCCEILDSQRVPITDSDRIAGEYPYYGANGIQDYVDDYIFDDELVLLAEDGGNFGSKTRPIAYRVSGKCWVNNHAHVLKPKAGLDVDYLCYSLMFYNVGGMVNGATRQKLTQAAMRKMLIPKRSLEEQLEIVSIIKKIQEIISYRKEELEQLDLLIKARFVEMFGDSVVNEKGWATKPFLEMGNCKNGMNFHYDDAGVDIHCLGVGDFADLSIIEDTSALPLISLNEMPSDEYLLKDDDIVFVRSNGNKALVGRSLTVYPGDVLTTFSGFCIRYRKNTDEILVPYLLRVLKSDPIRKKMAGRGANIQNLNQQILGTLIIPVPPLELQQQFAAFVAQVDKSKFININIIPEGGFYNGDEFYIS
jgi:restriction endonuclease S subunit